MAEAASIANLQFLKESRTPIDFYSKPQYFSNITTTVARSWRERSKRFYNRFVQISYPNQLPYLGLYSASIYAAQKLPSLPPNIEKFIPNQVENFGAWTIEKQNQLFGAFVIKCADLVGTIINKTLPAAVKPWFDSFIDFFVDRDTFKRGIFILATWLGFCITNRYLYKSLLSYIGFLYENPRTGYSWKTKIWAVILKLVRGNPKLMSTQSCLPNLPLPSVNETCERWLASVKPIYTDDEYNEAVALCREFSYGVGRKLQRWLQLKRLLTKNWVTDWWEEFVYLTSRSPIMINSNFYIICQGGDLPSNNQTAVAAMYTSNLFKWRWKLLKEELEPQTAAGFRPVCMAQYERIFNTTRIPSEKRDHIIHHEDSQHIIVYHNKKYFRVQCYSASGRLLSAAELQDQYDIIIADQSRSAIGEDICAALTAGSRDKWYNARKKHFCDVVNKATLYDIESAAFFVSLDDNTYDHTIGNKEDGSQLSEIAGALIHGSCTDIWFDKSFTLKVFANGVVGFNGEHAWADAPVMGMTSEYVICMEQVIGYDAEGNARGERTTETKDLAPTRLRFQFTKQAIEDIKISYNEAKLIADDLDINVKIFKDFGKHKITKVFKDSPDAFIQMALQVAHLLDMQTTVLTYESAMTRLWRDGRTETVRPATLEAVTFAKMILDTQSDKSEVIAQFRKASKQHVMMNLNAMAGRGVDRHLFGLYVVSKALNLESSFLNKALSQPWGLSTSQTPTNQLDYYKKQIGFNFQDCVCPGGGFGPVDPNGYGCCYLFIGDNNLTFHVSSKKSCEKTNSARFTDNIVVALRMMAELLS